MKNLKVVELKKIAKELKIKGYYKMRKSELVEIIESVKVAITETAKEDKLEKKVVENGCEVVSYKENAEWHEIRKLGIGGSDIAGVLGQSKYKSPIDIFFDKTQGSEFEGNKFTFWGLELEPVISNVFQKKHEEFQVIQYKKTFKRGRALSNTDRVLYSDDKGYGVLEIKTTSSYNSKAWDDETVPQEYYCQVMHYLAVTGFQYAYLVVLIGGNEYKEFYIERNDQECEYILEECNYFWNEYVVKNEIPPADGSNSYSEYQKQKALDNTGNKEIEINNLDSLLEDYKNKSESIKETEKQMELIKQKIMDSLIKNDGTFSKCEKGKASLVFTKRSSIDKKEFEKDYSLLITEYRTAEEKYKSVKESVSLRIS
ncbi:MAG: lambda-exonuclease family protein [Cetobacterium sp.]